MRKLLLITFILVVGCAPTKPPTTTFYIGMTKVEFLDKNSNTKFKANPITIDSQDLFIDQTTPYVIYNYAFENDTLQAVFYGKNKTQILWNTVWGKQIDYDKYATPPK